MLHYKMQASNSNRGFGLALTLLAIQISVIGDRPQKPDWSTPVLNDVLQSELENRTKVRVDCSQVKLSEGLSLLKALLCIHLVLEIRFWPFEELHLYLENMHTVPSHLKTEAPFKFPAYKYCQC